MNRAVQMPGRCWEVASEPDPDCGWPHCATEQEARAIVGEYEHITATVTLLPAPCWEALCLLCGEPVEHDEYGRAHYRSAFDAESDEDVFCDQGCEPPAPDLLAPSTEGMETLPGLGEVAS